MDDSTPSDQVSLGDYPNGTVFRLVRGIRGSSYSVGDRFMLIAEEDCHSPNTLKLGGMGEGFFIDPAGQPLKIEADESQFRVIFEAVVESPPPEVVLTEGETVDPDPKLVTEEKFSEFRKGLAGVLTEIAAIRTERGERGPRGYTGVQGDRGERGEPGPQGEDGAVGAQGEPGPQGEVGPQGPQGERGQRGEPGARGADGKQGTVGPMGPQGPQGERGPQGAPGVAGTMGPRGEAGTQGIPGKDGADGKDGTDGRDGKTGKAGPRGPKGDRGPVGARGEAGPKGDRGSTGESGVLTAKFPLVYDADEKSIAIDEERLDKILKKIMGGGKVSPQDMGWLASTGGGGKVAVYINGSKVTPDVRTLDFSGAGVSYTKVGGKVTVNITGGGGDGVTGPTGDTGPQGPQGIQGPTGPVGATGAGGALGYWGSFWDTTNKTVASTTTAYGITFNNSDPQNNGVTVVDGSKITFQSTGVYNLQFSAQVFNTENNQEHEATFWLKKNGTDIPDTAGVITVTGKHSGVTGAALPSWNWMLPLNANDYVELYWHTNSTNVLLGTLPAGTSPVHSVSPAVIFTAQQVMYTQVGPTGPTGPTGATPTDYVVSFNGRTGAVQGVSSANGLTGAVSFLAGAGITLSTSGSGISFAIHYGATGGSAPFSIASRTNLDKFLFQDNETGLMQIVSYSTILTKAAQVGEILSTSASYIPNNTNFVVQNTTTGVTEMVSANNVFSSIDGGMYADSV